VSKITKKGPKVPKYFQDFIDNMFTPLMELVKQDHELLMKVKQNQEQDHKLLKKVIKLNNLKTE